MHAIRAVPHLEPAAALREGDAISFCTSWKRILKRYRTGFPETRIIRSSQADGTRRARRSARRKSEVNPELMAASPPAAYLWQAAAALAAEAHRGQTSPGTSTPYVAHVSRVAMLVASGFGCSDPEVLAAAYLHDVLEKTDLPRTKLERRMGPRVADWVEWLSKGAKGPEKDYWQLLAAAPWQARMIKLADALDHLNGPEEYLEERLESARKAADLATSGEPPLLRGAALLLEAIAQLGSRSGPG
jgi:hypothetical protein